MARIERDTTSRPTTTQPVRWAAILLLLWAGASLAACTGETTREFPTEGCQPNCQEPALDLGLDLSGSDAASDTLSNSTDTVASVDLLSDIAPDMGVNDSGGTADIGADDVAQDTEVASDGADDVGTDPGGDDPGTDVMEIDTGPEGPCPADMVFVEGRSFAWSEWQTADPEDAYDVNDFCIDTYEAPNRAEALPLVMYDFLQAEEWCEARGKRLCFNDEWSVACSGSAMTRWPYGPTREAGVCRDEATWRTYSGELLGHWPRSVSSPDVESLAELFEAARVTEPATVEHLEFLYQATPAGAREMCTNEHGAYDLTGNIEEWARRRDGGETNFHGSLKGRYWAEHREYGCYSDILAHADLFRFYEIGFRCCVDIE